MQSTSHQLQFWWDISEMYPRPKSQDREPLHQWTRTSPAEKSTHWRLHLSTPVLLHSGVVTHLTQKTVCKETCPRCYVFFHCCECDNIQAPATSSAHYEAYWCVALNGVAVPQNEGYLFGGYYTSKDSNPVTGVMSCPQFFYPLHMGEDIEVCVSNDYERGFAHAIDFAGFYSCSVGNPLAISGPSTENQARWTHACPHGYAQHLVTVEDGCEINFCMNAGIFKTKTLTPAKLPPFRKHPKFKYNVTDALYIYGVYGNVWVKTDEGVWDKVNPDTSEGQALLAQLAAESNLSPRSGNLSDGAKAGIAISVITVAIGVFTIGIATCGRKVYKNHKQAKLQSDNYEHINDSGDTGGTNSA